MAITSNAITVYGFETSNNFKVRVGLGFKRLPYQFRTIAPNDRSQVIKVSGQPFTPVLVHGDIVVPDSAAILRYLDANFRLTPQLYSSNYDELREIEEWESWGRVILARPLLMLVRARRAGRDDPAEVQQATKLLASACQQLQEHLAGSEWLVGDRLTAADVTCAPVMYRASEPDMLPLPDNIDVALEWMSRVMAYDAGKTQ